MYLGTISNLQFFSDFSFVFRTATCLSPRPDPYHVGLLDQLAQTDILAHPASRPSFGVPQYGYCIANSEEWQRWRMVTDLSYKLRPDFYTSAVTSRFFAGCDQCNNCYLSSQIALVPACEWSGHSANYAPRCLYHVLAFQHLDHNTERRLWPLQYGCHFWPIALVPACCTRT